MRNYEICLVLNQNLEEAARGDVLQKVKDYIVRFGGDVKEPVEEWGKKRFAYEINHMKEGYYYFVSFDGDTKVANEMESQLRIMDNVVRYLVVRKDND